MRVAPSSVWKLQYLESKPVVEKPLLDESLMKFSEISLIKGENYEDPSPAARNNVSVAWSLSSISNSHRDGSNADDSYCKSEED